MFPPKNYFINIDVVYLAYNPERYLLNALSYTERNHFVKSKKKNSLSQKFVESITGIWRKQFSWLTRPSHALHANPLQSQPDASDFVQTIHLVQFDTARRIARSTIRLQDPGVPLENWIGNSWRFPYQKYGIQYGNNDHRSKHGILVWHQYITHCWLHETRSISQTISQKIKHSECSSIVATVSHNISIL